MQILSIPISRVRGPETMSFPARSRDRRGAKEKSIVHHEENSLQRSQINGLGAQTKVAKSKDAEKRTQRSNQQPQRPHPRGAQTTVAKGRGKTLQVGSGESWTHPVNH